MRKKSPLGVLCLLAVISLVCAFAQIAAAEPMEVSGTVYATEWDADGKVIAVEIVTDEGDAFTVSSAGKGSELLKLEDRVVTATGMIATDENERETITISGYVIQE